MCKHDTSTPLIAFYMFLKQRNIKVPILNVVIIQILPHYASKDDSYCIKYKNKLDFEDTRPLLLLQQTS